MGHSMASFFSLHGGHDCKGPQHDPAYYAQCASLLKQYGHANQLSHGRLLHAQLRLHEDNHNTFVGNCLVEMYGRCGRVEEAQAAFDNIHSPNTHSWNILMNVYAENDLFEHAQSVFNQIKKPNSYSWNTLLKAYSNDGNVQRARNVFSEMPFHDVVSWTAMLTALSKHGHSKESLQLFYEMQSQCIEPNKVTFACALDACADEGDLIEGQAIHTAIVGTCCENNVEVGNALIDMYGKCKSLDDAMVMFNRMRHHDIVTYNAMLGALVDNESWEEALKFYDHVQEQGACMDRITYLYGLNTCASMGAPEVGERLHSKIVCIGYDKDVVGVSALVNMYGKCGNVCHALSVFSAYHQKDVVSWNSIMSSLFHNGQAAEALELFFQMHVEGCKPNQISIVCASNACASLGILAQGQGLHALVVELGYAGDLMVGNSLMDMYGKCESPADAEVLFNKMTTHDIVSWNALIAAYAQNLMGKEALEVLHSMESEGVNGDNITFVSSLSACATTTDIQTGQKIHTVLERTDYIYDTLVGNALVHMYGRCGCMLEARVMFDRIPHRDVTSWNVLLSVLSDNGYGQEVLSLFHSMEFEAIAPDTISFMCALDACKNTHALEDGQHIHSAIILFGHEQNAVLENTLISLYAICGALDDAHDAFSKIPHRNVFSWNTIMAALSQRGYSEEVFYYFNKMQDENAIADAITYTCTLTSCARMTDLEEGHQIHALITNEGFLQDVMIGNALISMYGKCGSVEEASIMFNKVPRRDIISWNAILAAYAQNGHGKKALDVFDQMDVEDCKPNEATFVCVLMACTHVGQVDQARHYFLSMRRDYGIAQTHAHIGHMIDLLGRAGHLDEAEELTNTLPSREARASWLHLLGACKIHSDLGRAKRAASGCLEIDTTSAGPYVVLSNIYASTGGPEVDGGIVKGASIEDEPIAKVSEVRHARVLDDLLNLQVCNANEELQRLTRESASLLGS